MIGRIVEIFRSIQGEGKFAGREMVFIRLAGCNIARCSYCDTDFSQYKEMDAESVIREAVELSEKFPRIDTVSVTGGEPLLQTAFLKILLPGLKRRGLKILFETNGTMAEEYGEISEFVDIVSMDIKLPGALGGKTYWKEHAKFINSASDKDLYVKVVVGEKTSEEDFLKAVAVVKDIDDSMTFIIQPETGPSGEITVSGRKMGEFYSAAKPFLRDVRIVPQMHKLMGVR